MQKGEMARGKQQWKDAQEAFAAAYNLADKSSERRDQAEAAIRCAQSFRAEATSSDSPAMNQAMSWYDKAIKYGDRKQAALAGNNLGVILVQRGQFDRAVRIYRMYVTKKPMTDTWEPGADDPVYLCNFAQALEKLGDDKSRQEAFDVYWRVLRGVQQYSRASSGILRILLKSTPYNLDEAVRLLDFLLPPAADGSDDAAADRPRQLELAGQTLHELLKAWADNQNVTRLLPSVIRYYEFAVATPSDVNAIHDALLQNVSMESAMARMIGEIRQLHGTALLGDPGPYLSEDPERAWQRLPELAKVGQGSSKDARQVQLALSRLLVHIGDYYYRESLKKGEGRQAPTLAPDRAAKQALARYAVAYQLDPTYARAALNVAATLHEHGSVFGKDAERQFIELLWYGKIQAYQKLQPRNKEEWANIALFHRILATIFEKDPMSLGLDPKNPRSPVYQWDHAVTAEKRIEELDKNYPPNPGLHISLAKSWERAKEPARAFNSYLDAAESFQKSPHVDKATVAIKEADRLRGTPGLVLDANQRQRFDQIAKKPPIPPGPIRRQELYALVQRFEHPERVTALAFAPQVPRLVVAGGSVVKSWDVNSRKESIIEMPRERKVYALAFARDGKFLAIGRDKDLSMHDGDNYREIGVLNRGEAPVMALDFGHRGPLCVAASSDGKVNVWDATNGKQIHRYEALRGTNPCVAFAGANDRMVLYANVRENSIRAWDRETGREIRRFEGHEKGIYALAVSGDGRYLVSAGIDQTARLWDTESGKLLNVLWRHSAVIRSVVIAPAGKTIAAVGVDGKVKVWELSGKELATLDGVPGASSLAFSPGGEMLAVGGGVRNQPGQVIVWRMK
jgi:hypothetical protein